MCFLDSEICRNSAPTIFAQSWLTADIVCINYFFSTVRECIMNFSTTREFLCHKLHCLLYHFLVQIFYSNVDFTKDANLPDDGMDYFPFDHYWLATSQVWPPATQNRFSRGLFSTLTLNYLKVYYCSFCYCCYYYILHYFFKSLLLPDITNIFWPNLHGFLCFPRRNATNFK